ncbi:MAG: hypothetical protein LBG78_02670 [Azoarcus sp.]|nr:hypothetical protein [Azoarcus sp.]
MNHIQIDARSLDMHRLITAKIHSNPALFNKVLPTILRWRNTVSPSSLPYLNEWETLVQQGMDTALAKATEDSESARALRQSTPFVGILTPKERFDFLKKWKYHG